MEAKDPRVCKDKELNKALKEDESFIQVDVGNITLIHYTNNKMDRPKIVI